MGIYDRDYYRREGPSFLGSLTGQGQVTNWLIGINVVCFLLQNFLRSRIGITSFGEPIWSTPFTDALLLNVPLVYEGQVWRLLSYAFLHATIWHILFNMLVLFFFGRQVEEAIGGVEYLCFYLVAAVASGLGFVLAYASGIQSGFLCLGASGAVTAALLMAACINPRQIIYVFLVLPVPIWGFVVLSIAMDFFGLLGDNKDNVATSAHLAGAAFGFCYYKLNWRLTGWFKGLSSLRSRPRLRVYREEEEAPTPRPTTRTAPAPRHVPPDDELLEAQVDTILEKIQRVGMTGLTDGERQVLVRASEAIKRRRN